MKVMITAGCTVEKIDSVRSITNISTGRLGSLTAEAFALSEDVEEIFYLCNKTAVLPQANKVNIIYIESVANLTNTIADIHGRHNIDIIVHSMAVSDYRVKTITSMAKIKSAIHRGVEIEPITSDTEKTSSDIDELTLIMEKTPKVISIFQNISPQSILVGFKLLDSVTPKTLIDTGFRLLMENGCSFVLANDLSEIDENCHIGHLIDAGKNYTKYETKKEIAAAITAETIREYRKRRVSS